MGSPFEAASDAEMEDAGFSSGPEPMDTSPTEKNMTAEECKHISVPESSSGDSHMVEMQDNAPAVLEDPSPMDHPQDLGEEVKSVQDHEQLPDPRATAVSLSDNSNGIKLADDAVTTSSASPRHHQHSDDQHKPQAADCDVTPEAANDSDSDESVLFVSSRTSSVSVKLEDETDPKFHGHDVPPSSFGHNTGTKQDPITFDDDDHDDEIKFMGSGIKQESTTFDVSKHDEEVEFMGSGVKQEPITADTGDEDLKSVGSGTSVKDESGEYKPDPSAETDDDLPSRKRRATGHKKAQRPNTRAPRKAASPAASEQTVEYDTLAKELKDLNGEKYELLKTVIGSNFQSPVEQSKIQLITTRVAEIEAKLQSLPKPTRTAPRRMPTREGSGTDPTDAPRKGQRAKTSREWFARDNEARRGVIEKKRKVLHQETVASGRPASKKKVNAQQKHVDRMADGMEQIQKKAPLSFAKLQYSNPMQARMARTDLENPEDFAASSKSEQLQHHMKDVPDGCDAATIRADQRKLDRASKTFGDGNCKPVNGRWAITGMKTPLFNHQLLGSSWMLDREFSADKGGVNADEMGMGKTIQTLVTIVANPPTLQDLKDGRRTTLVVVPANVVNQWMKEIRDHVKVSHIEDIHHYKASKNEDKISLRKKDVIVTSYYEVLNGYLPKNVRKRVESGKCSEEERKELTEEHLGDLFRIPFHRVVLDEAHAIKDPMSQTSYACRGLTATYRWCLSGTPIQNKVEEFWPYLAFLQVSWAQSLKSFRQLLGNLDHPSNKKRFETMINEVVQRRTMRDPLLGKRIYSIPDCLDEVRSFPLTKEEQLFYRVVEERYRDIINFLLRKYRAQGRRVSPKDLQIYIVFLTRLRQATAHPFLLEPAMKTTLRLVDLECISASLKLFGGKKPAIDQIREWRAKNNPTPDTDAALLDFGISDFGRELDMEQHINIAMASKNDEVCNLCFQMLSNPQIAECDHVYCKECIEKAIYECQEAGRDKPYCPECDKPLVNLENRDGSATLEEDDDAMSISTALAASKGVTGDQADHERKEFQEWRKFKARSKGRQELVVTDKYDRRIGNDYFNIQPRLKQENTMFLRNSDKRYPEPMVPSAKTTAVKEIILQWQTEAEDDKIIIFTQFLEESAILGRMLQAENIDFVYYFGGMVDKHKTRALEGLRNVKEIKVLVASLKAGGVGLNVTCANRVIITDPWWNASIELQAYARVFRIGQTKKCHFVSLLAENTIDHRIASLQAEKLKNIENALQHSKTPSVEEMASLFGHLTEDEEGNLVIEADYKD
ncbi:putative RING-type domain-containing protein [Seiridium cardinale]